VVTTLGQQQYRRRTGRASERDDNNNYRADDFRFDRFGAVSVRSVDRKEAPGTSAEDKVVTGWLRSFLCFGRQTERRGKPGGAKEANRIRSDRGRFDGFVGGGRY